MSSRGRSGEPTFVVLGAGSILPRAGYGCAGYALDRPGERLTLFDCGPGTMRSLGECGYGVEDVERVVLSHYHPDHCLDIAALLFARKNPNLGERPRLEIIGPRGLRALLVGFRATFGRWVDFPDTELIEVGVPDTLQVVGNGGGLELACIATGHTDHAVAWRATLPDGETLAFSGDTGEVEAIIHAARGVDLFVAECSAPDADPLPGHLTPGAAARLATRAACTKLVLTHFYPGVDPESARKAASGVFAGPIELAHDGSRHSLR